MDGDLYCALAILPHGKTIPGYLRNGRCYYAYYYIEHEAKEFKIFNG